jgi:hypothetical protein
MAAGPFHHPWRTALSSKTRIVTKLLAFHKDARERGAHDDRDCHCEVNSGPVSRATNKAAMRLCAPYALAQTHELDGGPKELKHARAKSDSKKIKKLQKSRKRKTKESSPADTSAVLRVLF